jgi:TPP-dependent 2-oxoacid decarboxylase
LKYEVGNSNELNGAYAADGYSRIKGCPGVSEYFLFCLKRENIVN